MEVPGEWYEDSDEWTTPFTDENLRVLSATPAVVNERVVCIRARPLCSGAWLVYSLPARESDITCEADAGEIFEVQIGTMTMGEFEAMGEFPGW